MRKRISEVVIGAGEFDASYYVVRLRFPELAFDESVKRAKRLKDYCHYDGSHALDDDKWITEATWALFEGRRGPWIEVMKLDCGGSDILLSAGWGCDDPDDLLDGTAAPRTELSLDDRLQIAHVIRHLIAE